MGAAQEPDQNMDDDRTVVRQPPLDGDDEGNRLPNGTRVGDFEIVGLAGEGGFGIVYEARDHRLERTVALKEYMPSTLASRRGRTRQVRVKSERDREAFEAGLASFVGEAKLLAHFDHPSLVKVYQFLEANGTAYMVMPLYRGVTLKDQLKRMLEPPDEAWLKAMLLPITQALETIHREHCYHRDIAPDNILLLEGSGEPMLLDFGAARRVIVGMTQQLTTILKPAYAPIEQYGVDTPGMEQGPWTDVYALAATVYYAINGKTVPQAPTRAALRNDASFEPAARLAAGRYSERFLRGIDQALRVMPVDRTRSIAEFTAQLGLQEAAADAQTTRRNFAASNKLVRPAAAVPGGVAAPRGKAWMAGGAGLALLIAGGIFIATRPAPPAVDSPVEEPASPAGPERVDGRPPGDDVPGLTSGLPHNATPPAEASGSAPTPTVATAPAPFTVDTQPAPVNTSLPEPTTAPAEPPAQALPASRPAAAPTPAPATMPTPPAADATSPSPSSFPSPSPAPPPARRATPAPAPRPEAPPRASAENPTRPPAAARARSTARCTEINERGSLQELTAEEINFLRSECK